MNRGLPAVAAQLARATLNRLGDEVKNAFVKFLLAFDDVPAQPLGEPFAARRGRRDGENQLLLFAHAGLYLVAVEGEETSIAAWPTRLLPSTKGWLLMSEKPSAEAFSTTVW